MLLSFWWIAAAKLAKVVDRPATNSFIFLLKKPESGKTFSIMRSNKEYRKYIG